MERHDYPLIVNSYYEKPHGRQTKFARKSHRREAEIGICIFELVREQLAAKSQKKLRVYAMSEGWITVPESMKMRLIKISTTTPLATLHALLKIDVPIAEKRSSQVPFVRN
jgi:hypothetical protein